MRRVLAGWRALWRFPVSGWRADVAACHISVRVALELLRQQPNPRHFRRDRAAERRDCLGARARVPERRGLHPPRRIRPIDQRASATLASTLILSAPSRRSLALDDLLRPSYGIALPEAGVTIRQILTHSSAAPPGESFHYDPDRYAQLARVVEACVPQPYRKTVAVQLLERLAMKDSVPGRDVQDDPIVAQSLFAESVQQRYRDVLERLAMPYKIDKKGRSSRSVDLTPESISASSGVISTVRDLARFDAALDSALLLRDETLSAAWTNAVGRDRMPLPTGLGWFVQKYNAEAVVWHFGLTPNGYSSLILKIPAKRLTLILLANSDGLSSPFDLASGDVTKSLFAMLFLRLFA